MKSVITIGRGSHCDIIISHDKVSREHARVSIVGGHYVYEDVGKNGSVIGGRILNGQKVTVAPGTEILLAGKVPLPWQQIYSLLPLKGVRPLDNDTGYQVYASQQSIEVGWAILAFIIPITGWIMYFVWQDDYPRKASQANVIAWVSFIINLITILTYIY